MQRIGKFCNKNNKKRSGNEANAGVNKRKKRICCRSIKNMC